MNVRNFEFREEFADVFTTVINAHVKKLKTLTDIDLMKYRLETKLNGWMTRETEYRIVGCSEVVEKIFRYAPKTILRNRDDLKDMIVRVWGVDRDIESEELEDIDYELDVLQRDPEYKRKVERASTRSTKTTNY